MSDTRALTGNRQLVKSFQPFVADWDNANVIYVTDLPSTNWVNASQNCWYLETYFDMDGYTRDMLTVTPMSCFVQEAGRYQMTNPGNQRLLVLDLVTTERIEDVGAFENDFRTNNNMIGFPGSDVDFTQVLFGRFREFLPVTQAATAQDIIAPVCDQQFGSLEPTTATKLWIYKIIMNIGLPSATLARIRFPSSRVVMQIDVNKEGELPFMMRQKRSFELSNY